ncbi:hypothetical protein MUB24_19200 [Lederbergia sp. NSJ-179]|uniref:hypothetical protein n=1 Tax=Lederbergia sp. NSJ-179 TaxID=2931402 RepID=UPI001FD1D5E5|nr:hypothetical protein [Lederbergia sp. NSJ-179]MCJ7842965.1 hypothetical protein [Lederbergia sp. NSJ-179]
MLNVFGIVVKPFGETSQLPLILIQQGFNPSPIKKILLFQLAAAMSFIKSYGKQMEEVGNYDF